MATLYKRRGSGVWWCRVRSAHGRMVRRSTKCTDKEAARHVAAEYERAGSSPTYRAASSTTFSAAINRMIDDRIAKGRAAPTIKAYTTAGRHLARVLGADTPLTRIDAQAVDRYLAKRRKEGAAPYTIRLERVTLGQVLSLAIRHKYFDKQLAEVMPLRPPTGYTPGERWLTVAELDGVLAGLPVGRAAHVAFMVATGSTIGESLRARREDATPLSVRIWGTKNKGRKRVVPVLDMFRPLLERALRDAEGTAMLFYPWKGAARTIGQVCARLGIPRATPHDLRRTSATWLLQGGVAPNLIGKFLGHTTSAMVDRVYGKMTPEALGKLMADRLGPVPDRAQSPSTDDGSGAIRGEIGATCCSCDQDEVAAFTDDCDASPLSAVPVTSSYVREFGHSVGTPEQPWRGHMAWLAGVQRGAAFGGRS